MKSWYLKGKAGSWQELPVNSRKVAGTTRDDVIRAAAAITAGSDVRTEVKTSSKSPVPASWRLEVRATTDSETDSKYLDGKLIFNRNSIFPPKMAVVAESWGLCDIPHLN